MAENNHSAEWLRGKIEGLEEMGIAFETPSLQLLAVECRNRACECRTLLAAAEAREAGTPTAEEVIAACLQALDTIKHLSSGTTTKPCDCAINGVAQMTIAKIAAWEAARR